MDIAILLGASLVMYLYLRSQGGIRSSKNDSNKKSAPIFLTRRARVVGDLIFVLLIGAITFVAIHQSEGGPITIIGPVVLGALVMLALQLLKRKEDK